MESINLRKADRVTACLDSSTQISAMVLRAKSAVLVWWRKAKITMSANPQQLDQKLPPQPKAPERDSIPHGSKDHEIDNLKRLLADVSKRLDKLK